MSAHEITAAMWRGEITSRSACLQMLAHIETCLLREFLADGSPETTECNWIENVPQGPSPEGVDKPLALQARYGAANVATGNAVPPMPRQIGLYVRREAIARAA